MTYNAGLPGNPAQPDVAAQEPETVNFASSNIDSAQYDPQTQQLDVTFLRTGATYSYPGVPVSVWEAFKNAPSAGHFLRQEIAGRY